MTVIVVIILLVVIASFFKRTPAKPWKNQAGHSPASWNRHTSAWDRLKTTWENNKPLYEYPRCPYCEHPVHINRPAVEYEETYYHPACYMAERPLRKNLEDTGPLPTVGQLGQRRAALEGEGA